MAFQNIEIKDFSVETASDLDCLKFVAEKKWGDGFECRKCGHTNYCKGKTPFSRRCTRCKHDESATANTIFHRCHIPIKEAFYIVHRVCHDPAVSTYELSRQIELRQMTCWKLKARLMDCIKSRGEIDLLYMAKENNFNGKI